MTKKTISEFEDQISKAKDEFFGHFRIMLSIVEENDPKSSDVRKELTELHKKGVDYFNLFERSISEYFGVTGIDENIRNTKVDDAIGIANTIINYWTLLKSLEEKFKIRIPQPSERAYSKIQKFIKGFDPERAQTLKEKFLKAQLPTHGFTIHTPPPNPDKKQVTFGIISGFSLLIVLLIIGIIIDCPTQSQNDLFKTILALAAASFAAAIPGLIKVRYREIITASGALAVFVIVFLFKPAEISDFKECQENINGTVYFGTSPVESIDIYFLKQYKSTKTDNFGNFSLPFDFSSVDEVVKIQLKNSELALDTIVSIQKSELRKTIDIYIKKYCVKCIQIDSLENVVSTKSKCSASHESISDYIDVFTRAGKDQGLTTRCEIK